MTREERFWAKVQKAEGNACWIWTSQRKKGAFNYGRFEETKNGKCRLSAAHRVSWELTYGPIPDGICVLHRCDNPPCVRPDHLFLGTQSDNMVDMVAKGRAAPLGDHTPAAKNRAKAACPKCGGPLVRSKHASQNGRRRCPGCTRKHQAEYMRKWKARNLERGDTPGGV